jgi:putative ABC transport system permease protein
MLSQIALRNTIKNWRHSLSALLSLGASFVALVIFDGYMANVEGMYFDQYKHAGMWGDVIVENKNIFSQEGISEPWKFWMTKAEQDAISQFAENHKTQVLHIVRSLDFQGMISNGQQSQIFAGRGYDLKSGRSMRGQEWAWNATFGRPLDESPDGLSLSYGQGLAKRMGCKFHHDKNYLNKSGSFIPEERPFECVSRDAQISAMTPEGQLNAMDLTVFGLIDGGYKDVDDRLIHTSLETAQTLMNTDKITNASMDFAPGVSIPDMMGEFNKEVTSRFPNLHIIPWKDHRIGDVYTKTMDFLSIFRNFIIIVILVVSTMSVVNTLVKIVKERTREIGTLRSIGFRSRQVAAMFLYESLYLSMIGSGIGLVLSIIVTWILNSLRIMYKAGMLSQPVAFQVDFVAHSYVTAWLLLMVVSLLASYFSTLSILRTKIVDNLIHA